ncbi:MULTISPECIES: recombinase family protein [environmental samples]|uniref:recombinase family protein n=1 Tax=environmental samples TaxID=876090 RepID=UPI00033B423D|nr:MULTISPECIES: recombinase family protein [environmental samples]CDC68369.1 putative uncharacterized protein [Oscillibacter sp. CAG:155]
MRIPYGYQLESNNFIICQEKAEVVRMIFDCYLSGASLGKVADMLSERRIPSPTGKERWTRAAIDKLLSNAKYIPIVGTKIYMDVQFEKSRRCNIDYDKAGNPRKATRYQSPAL